MTLFLIALNAGLKPCLYVPPLCMRNDHLTECALDFSAKSNGGFPYNVVGECTFKPCQRAHFSFECTDQ